VRAYKNSANQSQKMLASTVQFSTYDQTPATRPHRTRALPQKTQRYEMQTGPAEINAPPGHPGRPAPSGPNSVPTNHPPGSTPLHTPCVRRRAGRTGSRPRPAAELVSVPPSSTTQATRGPSRTEEPSRPGAALHHPPTVSGQCSLERR
jgi:hypothetical protein